MTYGIIETFRGEPEERSIFSFEKLSIRRGRIGPYSFLVKVSPKCEPWGLKRGPILSLALHYTDGHDIASFDLSWNIRPGNHNRNESIWWSAIVALEEHYRTECPNKTPPPVVAFLD